MPAVLSQGWWSLAAQMTSSPQLPLALCPSRGTGWLLRGDRTPHSAEVSLTQHRRSFHGSTFLSGTHMV